MNKPNILILGGSEIAYQLAGQLQSLQLNIISSLAGRTQNPRLPMGDWRIGGFGGVDRLVAFLHENRIKLMIDATHAFAQRIQTNARLAAHMSNIPLWCLRRPPWQKAPGDRWIDVADEKQAASILPTQSAIFLALGRQHLQAFSIRKDVKFVARMLEKTDEINNFADITLVLDRPATKADEIKLLTTHKIDMLVCRNSGAAASYGKIAAARDLQLPVVMIMPPEPAPDIPVFTNIAALQQPLKQLFDQE